MNKEEYYDERIRHETWTSAADRLVDALNEDPAFRKASEQIKAQQIPAIAKALAENNECAYCGREVGSDPYIDDSGDVFHNTDCADAYYRSMKD